MNNTSPDSIKYSMVDSLKNRRQTDEENMNIFQMPGIRHPQGTRFPMKCKLDVSSKIQIPTETIKEIIKMPHIVQVRGEFNEEMAEDFANAFHSAENTGQEIIPIVIDSYGGDIYALMSMIDIIQASSVPVATIVTGKAMSAGAVLLSCGADGFRFASPNATIMIHGAWETGISGNADEVKVSAEELMRLSKKILEVMSLNIGEKRDFFHKMMSDKKNTDWYLSPKDAQKFNIVNHVRIPEFSVKLSVDIEFK